MDLPTYLRLLADRRESVAGLLPPSSPADEHGGTVTDTLQLALDRAESLAPPGTARAMLELISMFAPDGTPDAVLLGPAAHAWLAGAPPTNTAPNPIPERATLLALRALHRLSLITHHSPTPADGAQPVVEVHSLVQRAIRHDIPLDDHYERLTTAAADALEEAWSTPARTPDTETALYRSAEALLTHTDGSLRRDAGTCHTLDQHPLANPEPVPDPDALLACDLRPTCNPVHPPQLPYPACTPYSADSART
jgi:hypothetical protein